MQFYTIPTLNDNARIASGGITVELMGKAFSLAGKIPHTNDVDSLTNVCFVFLIKPLHLSSDENILQHQQEKHSSIAIVKKNAIFEVTDGQRTFSCIVHEGLLKAHSNKEILKATLVEQAFSSTDPIEQKAIDWLNNGRVGMSSATMCATFFPALKQHPIVKRMLDFNEDGSFQVCIPHDNSDFARCTKFLEAVPEARQRMDELKLLNSTWHSLVEKWSEIETVMEQNETKQAYMLIKDCAQKRQKPRV